MPYTIRKQKCKQSDGDAGSYALSYTDKEGKKHRACHTSKKKALGQIAAIEGQWEADEIDDKENVMTERLLREMVRRLLSERINTEQIIDAYQELESWRRPGAAVSVEDVEEYIGDENLNLDGEEALNNDKLNQNFNFYIDPKTGKSMMEPKWKESLTSPKTGTSSQVKGRRQSSVGVKFGSLNRWDDYNSTVPLAASTGGIGPGEERLADIFSGSVSGQSESFDLFFEKGTALAGKWEVKAPDASGQIRPGTEGIKAFRPINTKLNVIIDEITQFLSYPDIEELANSSGAGDLYKKIADFMGEGDSSASDGKKPKKTNLDLLQSGEITESRFEELLAAVEAVGDLKKKMQGNLLKVSVNNKKYQVSPLTMVKLSRLLGISDEETKGGVDAADAALALTNLNSSYYDDPKSLRALWDQTVDADSVFDLTGVILVTSSGFMPITRPYGENLKFARVTQGKPKFQTKIKGASGKKAWSPDNSD